MKIKVKLMKNDSVKILWWWQYLNPSTTMGRWCTIEFPVIPDYNACLHVVCQDAKEPDPRSNKHTTPVIKLKLMKTASVEMLWWRQQQYLNPSATIERWCTIDFPGWQRHFTFGKTPKSLTLDQTNTQRLSSSWIWWKPTVWKCSDGDGDSI